MAYRSTPRVIQRKDARRRAFLTAATRLFGRLGYHAATVPMIVAEAGTSTGTFYFYFRNKEDMFAATLSDVGERVTSAINASLAEAGPEPLVQMKAAVEGFVGFLSQHPQAARILIVESSGLSARLEAIRRSVVANHTRGVEDALRRLAPTLPAWEAGITARCWIGAVYEAAYSWLELPRGKRPPAKTLAEVVARFNLRGAGATAGSRHGRAGLAARRRIIGAGRPTRS